MKIAYDLVLKRPACVLIAVAMGADRDTALAFDTADWLVGLTPDLKLYEITPEQLDILIKVHQAKRDMDAAERSKVAK